MKAAIALVMSMLALNAAFAAAHAATVDRTGKVRVVINIVKKSDFTPPIRCVVVFSHATRDRSFSETLARRARFVGNTGRCILEMPFKWIGADDAEAVNLGHAVGFDFGLANEIKPSGELPAVQRMPINAERFPLPADGATIVRTYDVEM